MNLTLREADRHAVDLLLDRTPWIHAEADGNTQPLFASSDPSIGQRAARAQQLLALLEVLPQNDPPPDLLGRTLRFVENSRQHPAVMGAEIPNLMNSRPVV